MKYTVTEIRVRFFCFPSFTYELWGYSDDDFFKTETKEGEKRPIVFLGSNEFYYPTPVEAFENGVRHVNEFPNTYQWPKN
jgi:hypothetical protein